MAAAGLAGCLHEVDPDEDLDADDADADADVDEEPTGIRLLSSSFDVIDRIPGNAEDVADVSFDEAEGRVVVGGVIPGANSCRTAELESAGYDDVADVLELRVETVEMRDVEDVCIPVVMEISYHSVAEFSGGLPSTVSVYHDDELVVSVEAT